MLLFYVYSGLLHIISETSVLHAVRSFCKVTGNGTDNNWIGFSVRNITTARLK